MRQLPQPGRHERGPDDAVEWPTTGWQRSDAAAQGMDTALLARALQRARAQPSRFSLLVIRNGYLVVEEYFGGHHAGELFDVRSVTKSVTATLIGIALREGTIASLEQPLGELLPDVLPPGADPRTGRITIGDLLTMRAGMAWDATQEWALLASDDWLRWTLGQPQIAAPGTTFAYNTGLSQLLSVILTRATGRPASEYARARLFEPLGIHAAHWDADRNGHSLGGVGLSLRAADMAKLGFLYLNGGRWDGRQLLAPEFVQAATTAWSGGGSPEGASYGYHWWVSEDHAQAAFFAAGYGGQFVYVVPALALIVVTTAKWNLPPERTLNRDLITRGLLPAALGGGSTT